MKRRLSHILSVAFVVILCFAFTVPAYAFGLPDATVGTPYSAKVTTNGTEDFTSTSVSGTLPPGMTVTQSGYDLYLSGTPTAVGNYSFNVYWETENGAGAPAWTITVISAPATPTPTTTTTPTTSPEVVVPPTSSPVTATAPKLTKSPSGENISSGSSTSFIARADNAATYTWYVVGADGSTMTVSEANSKYTGVKITGDGTEKLVIANAPLSISGASFYCVFSNSAGSTNSASAKLTVTPAAQATVKPSVTASPSPTPSPSASPKATATPKPAASTSPNEEPASDPDDNHQHNFSNSWSGDNDTHWHECNCGERRDEDTHAVSTWTKMDKHTEMGICTVCGRGVLRQAQKSGAFGKIILGVVIVGALGAGGYFTYTGLSRMKSKSSGRRGRH